MNDYQVQGRFVSFGPGIDLRLSAAQAAVRSHAVEVVKKLKGGEVLDVRSTQHVQFKIGETIGLKECPKVLAPYLLDLEAATKPPALPLVEKSAL